eukprot:815200-Amorphochlora_amoeboformis.AAC.1
MTNRVGFYVLCVIVRVGLVAVGCKDIFISLVLDQVDETLAADEGGVSTGALGALDLDAFGVADFEDACLLHDVAKAVAESRELELFFVHVRVIEQTACGWA